MHGSLLLVNVSIAVDTSLSSHNWQCSTYPGLTYSANPASAVSAAGDPAAAARAQKLSIDAICARSALQRSLAAGTECGTCHPIQFMAHFPEQAEAATPTAQAPKRFSPPCNLTHIYLCTRLAPATMTCATSINCCSCGLSAAAKLRPRIVHPLRPRAPIKPYGRRMGNLQSEQFVCQPIQKGQQSVWAK